MHRCRAFQGQVNELLMSLGVSKRALIADLAMSSNGTNGSHAGGNSCATASTAPELRIRREIRREASGALRRSACRRDLFLICTPAGHCPFAHQPQRGQKWWGAEAARRSCDDIAC